MSTSNHESKLTEEQAREALNCPRIRGAATVLAKRLGVSLTVVCDIRDGKRWTHLRTIGKWSAARSATQTKETP